jgi:predicted esterase
MGTRRMLIPTLAFGALGLLLASPAADAAVIADAAKAAAIAPAPKPPELPRGQLVERVACAEHPEQTYALYLPKGYTPQRKWPILYAFDASSQGKSVAALFQSAAETYGWIVVSSWNTASDGPMEPNFAAMRALWADTHDRFAIDESRVYAAGFSGTVRFACILALTAPGTIRGIIGAGAGFPFGTPPKRGNPFVFFGTVGDRDFNWYEMNDLDAALAAVAVPHRIEHFAGIHDWPPPELASQAVAWMEMAAIKDGAGPKRPQDAALVAAQWEADRARARARAAAGHLAEALHTWQAMAADYAGLRPAADLAEAGREAATLAASPACRKELRDRVERDRRDKQILADGPVILARSDPGQNPGSDPLTVAQTVALLKIPELKARAASADAEESLAAKRILNTYLGQTGFYLPQRYRERKEYDRAIFVLAVGAEIRPDDPWVWTEIARFHALKGAPGHKKALEALRKAEAKGLADASLLTAGEDFAALRQNEEFQQILAQVEKRQ